MQEAVSAILHERARLEDGISRTLLLSIGAHVAHRRRRLADAFRVALARPRRSVATMTISLGGTEGPNLGGTDDDGGPGGPGDRRSRMPASQMLRRRPKPPEMVEPTVRRQADARRVRSRSRPTRPRSRDADGRRGDQDRFGAGEHGRRGDSVRRPGAGRRRRRRRSARREELLLPRVPGADGPEDPLELERATRAPAGSRSSSSPSAVTACSTNVELEKSSGQAAARSRGAARGAQDDAAAAAAARVHRRAR